MFCTVSVCDDWPTLLGVKFPNQASSIILLSKGPTAGVLSDSDVVEDKPAQGPTEEEEMEGSCANQEVENLYTYFSPDKSN